MTLTALALAGAVKAEAARLGFDAVAIGPATPPTHGAAFERWLDEGCAGSMDYLERTREERLDPGRLLPGARAVVAVASSYNGRDGESSALSGQGTSGSASERGGDAGGPRVARYAGRADYHDVLRPRLHALARFIESAAGPDVRSRAAIDTSAVLERDLAARAGLGWIGKNTNLLTPSLGSWFFIGIVLTTAGPAFDAEVPDRCGTCTACLDACPTGAFTAPYALDARRCIAYLTIEHRGDVAEALRPQIGAWIFGCDVCQDVCPWNRRAATTTEPAFAPATAPAAETLLGLDEPAFRARFRGTALWRARRSGLLRNAALVLGNRADAGAVPALRAAAADGDPVVRDAAAWALSRLTGTSLALFKSVATSQEKGVLTMHHDKRDPKQPQQQGGQGHEQNRDMGDQRNEEETGKPVQLDKDSKGGEQHQDRPHPGGGQQPQRPEPGRKPDQGQHTQR